MIRFHRRIEGELCALCRSRYFSSFTGTTLVLGWWGVISLVYTLFVLPADVVSHLGGLPVAGVILVMRRKFHHCPRCGNEQPAH